MPGWRAGVGSDSRGNDSPQSTQRPQRRADRYLQQDASYAVYAWCENPFSHPHSRESSPASGAGWESCLVGAEIGISAQRHFLTVAGLIWSVQGDPNPYNALGLPPLAGILE